MQFTRTLLLLAALGVPPRDSTGLVPLTDLGGGTYKGEQGGLYPGGQIAMPPAHLVAGLELARRIAPLDAEGRPSANGQIVMLASQNVDVTDPDLNPRLVVAGPASVNPKQVQVVWMLVAAGRPPRGWPEGTKKVQHEIINSVRAYAGRHPNLKLVYVSSPVYGGYADLEPYAYESGFAVQWAVAAKDSPWLAWGPYLWADGVKARKDGLRWTRDDFGPDGHQLSSTGCGKLARQLVEFLKTDLTARPWALATE